MREDIEFNAEPSVSSSLLMREGALIADDSPEALLQATGTADVESAFLSLIEAEVPS